MGFDEGNTGKIGHSKAYDDAQIVRAMLEHENNLLNDRINWLVTIQGLLLAGISFAWDKPDARSLVSIFCLLGVMVSLSGMTSLQLATQAMGELFHWWSVNSPDDYRGPDIQGLRAYRHKDLWTLRCLYPWKALPHIFTAAWIGILLVNQGWI